MNLDNYAHHSGTKAVTHHVLLGKFNTNYCLIFFKIQRQMQIVISTPRLVSDKFGELLRAVRRSEISKSSFFEASISVLS
jgi:hypothetical protein